MLSRYKPAITMIAISNSKTDYFYIMDDSLYLATTTSAPILLKKPMTRSLQLTLDVIKPISYYDLDTISLI